MSSFPPQGTLGKQTLRDMLTQGKDVSAENPLVVGEMPRSVIVLRFDDGILSPYTNAVPILDRYGYKGNFAVDCVRLGTEAYMTIEQLRELQRNGHEIINHSWTHPNLTASVSLSANANIGATSISLASIGYLGFPTAEFKTLAHLFDDADPTGELIEVVDNDYITYTLTLESGITGSYTTANNAKVDFNDVACVDRQLRDSQTWLLEQLSGLGELGRISGFAQPYGTQNNLIAYRSSFYYDYYSNIADEMKRLLVELTFLDGRGIAGGLGYSTGRLAIAKQAIGFLAGTKGLYGSIYFHEIAGTDIVDFEKIVAFIHNLGIPVVTFSQAYRLALSLGAQKVATIYYKESLAAGDSSVLGDCAPISLAGFKRVALTIEETYHASATAGGKLYLYISADGGNYDTEPVETKTLAFGAGATKRETYSPSDAIQRARFLKVVYENLDGAQVITGIKITATLGA